MVLDGMSGDRGDGERQRRNCLKQMPNAVMVSCFGGMIGGQGGLVWANLRLSKREMLKA